MNDSDCQLSTWLCPMFEYILNITPTSNSLSLFCLSEAKICATKKFRLNRLSAGKDFSRVHLNWRQCIFFCNNSVLFWFDVFTQLCIFDGRKRLWINIWRGHFCSDSNYWKSHKRRKWQHELFLKTKVRLGYFKDQQVNFLSEITSGFKRHLKKKRKYKNKY